MACRVEGPLGFTHMCKFDSVSECKEKLRSQQFWALEYETVSPVPDMVPKVLNMVPRMPEPY